MSSIIKLSNIVKKFYIGEPNELEILHGISLEVEEGEFVSIVGPSGSGKSTLMNMIGVLDRPTSGEYILDGINVGEANDSELSEIRNQKIGFVFQTYNLISKTNALKNIELPMLYAGVERSKRVARAKELLDLVEMGDRAKHLPEELSGGQKQRVAIARAMANDPAIILADEPTGALDSKTGRLVMDLFHKLNKEKGKTIVLITHSNELAAETDRIISIRDGNIVNVENKKEKRVKNLNNNESENRLVSKEKGSTENKVNNETKRKAQKQENKANNEIKRNIQKQENKANKEKDINSEKRENKVNNEKKESTKKQENNINKENRRNKQNKRNKQKTKGGKKKK